MFNRGKKKMPFQGRSFERDTTTDEARSRLVEYSISKALMEARAERDGLADRLADVLTLASITVGNNTDEYRSRDAFKDAQQSAFSADIKYAERRLQTLKRQIETYQTLEQQLSNGSQS